MKGNDRSVNILIGGEAGQGLQTIGPIFAKSLMRSGFHIHVTQTYESRVRGGHNTFAIRFGAGEVRAPDEAVDLLVALTDETVSLHEHELVETAYVVGDREWDVRHPRWVGAPFKEFGKRMYWNTAAIAVAAGLLDLDERILGKVIAEVFGKERSEENLNVMESSLRWLRDQPLEKLKGPQPVKGPPRLMAHGHEAVALGALSAGVKFCSFYPMSPATSIAQTLINRSHEMGLIVEQAEDEIAAINMAIGASFAGTPSLVPTSGGGFALMSEGVSLAAITETPVVVVIGQRPGPATGLATCTEQGDLWFVLHAGHGEFPRAVFAPGTMEECFHLTRRAFELAETYQGPMFVLTDHFLADSYRDMDPMDVESLPFVRPGADPDSVETPYRRYRITESGISPRLLPGLSRNLVVADSHEHKADGHMSYDPTVRTEMMNKRLRKGDGIRQLVVPPDYVGDSNPDLLLICWGSSKGTVVEAASRLRSKAGAVAVLHFSQVWPLVPKQFLGHLEQTKRVVAVESNAGGQLVQLIRRETGFHVQECVSRYDGRALTPKYIADRIDL
jgi:2-oxoglutarate ferredoxin oxidoreductase subunit alpha